MVNVDGDWDSGGRLLLCLVAVKTQEGRACGGVTWNFVKKAAAWQVLVFLMDL